MKRNALTILAIIGAAVFLSACVTPESAVKSSFHTINQFLIFEKAHQPAIVAQAPAVHAAAEGIRKQAPDAYRAVWTALEAYNMDPTPENKAAYLKYLKLIDDLAAIAETNLIKAKGLKL